ncbi:SRR1-domain-containing protein [Amanita rubescens]|nr:SRR1-domain-containing protein [Amanita rubescens]
MTKNISFPYTDFIPVRSKRRTGNRGKLEGVSPIVLLQGLRDELEADKWFAQCKQIIDESLRHLKMEFTGVICLGLGSPSSSHNARVQLAFLLEICDHLLIERHRISIYDPIFSEQDLSLLHGLELTVLSTNENGLYPVDAPTIVYMPHCDMELYENLLRANWKPHIDALKLLFIANQLSDYIDNNPLQVLKDKAPYLVDVVPLLQDCALPVSKTWPTAFNNIAVQFIPTKYPQVVIST